MKREVVTVKKLYSETANSLQLKLIAGENGLSRIIREPTVNRPGLALAGFTKYFASKRVQVIGNAESHFMKSLSASDREERYSVLFRHKMPCLVYCRGFQADDLLLKAAEKAGVPVFNSPLITMKFINLATLAMDFMFAPRSSEIGSMVDILGVGVLIRGESGIGKSECVLALIDRGYSFVADDITRVTLVDGKAVIGTSAEITRNHMEIRGIGLIDVAAMFGVKSIRHEKQIDLIITLKAWENVPNVERVGIEDDHRKILGVNIPQITIPVRPGRDLARLIEVAAFQTKLKRSGRNSAKEFNDRLIAKMTKESSL